MTAAPGAARGVEWDLIEAAQRGDGDAFGQLYARYVGEVSRFVGSRVRGDRPLAQDLTSETFVRALRGIDSVSYRGRDVGAWLTTIARNLVSDHVKSSRYRLERATADIGEFGTDQGSSPDQALISTEVAAEVRRCVAELPADQRECLRLRFWDELSVADTAAVMGRSENAVKALRHRAVTALRTAMADDDAALVPQARAVARDRLVRARQAVGEVRQRVAGEDEQAAEADRAQQLTRWHTDDHASRQRADDRAGGLALTADG